MDTDGSYAGYGICCGGNPNAGAGGTLTVKGGTINATGEKAGTYGIYATTKKALTVSGGILFSSSSLFVYTGVIVTELAGFVNIKLSNIPNLLSFFVYFR